jgi:hypothetical protein
VCAETLASHRSSGFLVAAVIGHNGRRSGCGLRSRSIMTVSLNGLSGRRPILGMDSRHAGRTTGAHVRQLRPSRFLSVMVAVPIMASNSEKPKDQSLQLPSGAFGPGGDTPRQYAPDPPAPKTTRVHWVLLAEAADKTPIVGVCDGAMR